MIERRGEVRSCWDRQMIEGNASYREGEEDEQSGKHGIKQVVAL
jgi:hypothetical protein